MSAPNKSYDPVQVSALSADAVAAAVTAALDAVAAAADLDALKHARVEHAGDRSTLALANREIGALPPHAKAEAGQRVGAARAAIRDAIEARRLAAGGRARRPGAGGGDRRRHPAVGPSPGRRPAPADHDPRAHRGRLRRHGLRGRRRPGRRGGMAELRRAQHGPGPPGPHDAGHVLHRAGRGRPPAENAYLAGAGPHHARRRSRRSTSSARAGSSARTSWTRRIPRSSTRSKGSRSTKA